MPKQILLTMNGEARNLRQWCELHKADYMRVYGQLRKGKSLEEALQYQGEKGKLFFTMNGETRNLGEWCKLYNVSYLPAYRQICLGKSLEDALQFPGWKPRKITLAGVTRLRQRWCDKIGISSGAYYHREKRGWSTEQMLQPKLIGRLLEAFGRKQTLKAWCVEHDKPYKLVWNRTRSGMPLELALTLAVGKYERRKK